MMASVEEAWTEYRAIYERPASFLDENPLRTDQGQPYVIERTGPHRTQEEARKEATYRSEESHAFVTGYEARQVTATEWKAQA